MTTDIEKFTEILLERRDLFSTKNADYGSSFRVEDVVGIVIRLGDKLSRLKRADQNGFAMVVQEEGLKELLLDIANYCDIGLLLLKEKATATQALPP